MNLDCASISRLLVFANSLLILSAVSSCATSNNFSGSSSQPEKVKINIRLEHLKSEDAWLATYFLPTQVQTLTFLTQTNQFRHDHWKVLTPGIKLEVIQNEEKLISNDPRGFSKVSVRFKTYLDETPDDYEFFMRFTDGGLIAYTGHLYATPSINSKKIQSVFHLELVPDQREKALAECYS